MVTSQSDTSITQNMENLDLAEIDMEIPQDKSQVARQLTEEERDKLGKDTQLVSEFKNKRFEMDAKKHWDLFYRRNGTNFFKDRYWTFREFEEITCENKCLLEIGCGVGNFMYPLLKENKKIFVYGCDFSTDAVNLLKQNPEYDTSRCLGFVCDVTKENSLQESLPSGVRVDFVSLIFVFSALHPDKMRTAVHNIAKVG
jgi:methyltransferase-like protein 6